VALLQVTVPPFPDLSPFLTCTMLRGQVPPSRIEKPRWSLFDDSRRSKAWSSRRVSVRPEREVWGRWPLVIFDSPRLDTLEAMIEHQRVTPPNSSDGYGRVRAADGDLARRRHSIARGRRPDSL